MQRITKHQSSLYIAAYTITKRELTIKKALESLRTTYVARKNIQRNIVLGYKDRERDLLAAYTRVELKLLKYLYRVPKIELKATRLRRLLEIEFYPNTRIYTDEQT